MRCKLYKYEIHPVKEASHGRRQAYSGQGEAAHFRHGEKGQIVIPKEARQIFGVRPGDTLLILGDEETGIIVTKPDVLREAANEIFGKMEK